MTSFTVMVWMCVAELPHWSVATYVRVMVVKPAPTTLTSLFVTDTLPQLSDAVAFGAGIEPTFTVTSAGANVNVGAVLSATVIT